MASTDVSQQNIIKLITSYTIKARNQTKYLLSSPSMDEVYKAVITKGTYYQNNKILPKF